MAITPNGDVSILVWGAFIRIGVLAEATTAEEKW
jgi:hypothetical protein